VSYVTAIAGVQERLRTVSGLAYVINGEPTSVQAAPMAYTLFDSVVPIKSNQVQGARYRVLMRVAVQFQDNQAAEDQLAPFVDSVPAAFAASGVDENGNSYASLGGRVNVAVVAEITSGEGGGFHSIAGTVHRTVTFLLDITDKR
jgi:hypothetical protein